MIAGVRYRFMKKGEEEKVCSLVEKVFNDFVAPHYGRQGIDEFFKFANPLALAGRAGPEQLIIVAEEGPDLVGMIEMRGCEHVAMLFVSRRGRGIASELLKRALGECRRKRPEVKRITVNSSPFAEQIYSKMGFRSTGPFQKRNGIIFMPMAYDFE